MNDELTPHDEVTSNRTSKIFLWCAVILLFLIGAVLNNVTLATQDMTDYTYVLWPSIVTLLCSAACLIAIALKGSRLSAFLSLVASLLVFDQLLEATFRISSILNSS